MSNEEITLWFGNVGSRLDKHGNVYTVWKNIPQDIDNAKPDIISIYQSVLKELGISLRIEDHTDRDPKTGMVRHSIIHEFETNGERLPYFHKSFGYQYFE